MKKQKIKTNDSMVKAVIKELDGLNPMGFALLRERLVWMAEKTAKSVKENPSAYYDSGAMLHLCRIIQEHCGFEELTSRKDTTAADFNF